MKLYIPDSFTQLIGYWCLDFKELEVCENLSKLFLITPLHSVGIVNQIWCQKHSANSLECDILYDEDLFDVWR